MRSYIKLAVMVVALISSASAAQAASAEYNKFQCETKCNVKYSVCDRPLQKAIQDADWEACSSSRDCSRKIKICDKKYDRCNAKCK